MSDKILIGLENIHSNNIRRCAICGIPIVKDNDSGWEVFVDKGIKTQPIYAWCEATWNPTGKKEESK